MERIGKLNRTYKAWNAEGYTGYIHEKIIVGLLKELTPPYELVNFNQWSNMMRANEDWKFLVAFAERRSFEIGIEIDERNGHLYFANKKRQARETWYRFLDLDIKKGLTITESQFTICGRYLVYEDKRILGLLNIFEE